MNCQICKSSIHEGNKGDFHSLDFPICSRCCTSKNTGNYHSACMVAAEFDSARYFDKLFIANKQESIDKRVGRYAQEEYPHKDFIDAIAKHLKPGDKVLEIGCGFGFAGEKLIKAVPGIEYIGIDVASECTAYAREELGVDARTMSSEDIEQFHQKFDMIFSIDVIEHLPFITKFIARSAKALKPRGFFAFDFPNRYMYPVPITKFNQCVKLLRQYHPRKVIANLKSLFSPIRLPAKFAFTFVSHPSFLFFHEIHSILRALNFAPITVEANQKFLWFKNTCHDYFALYQRQGDTLVDDVFLTTDK